MMNIKNYNYVVVQRMFNNKYNYLINNVKSINNNYIIKYKQYKLIILILVITIIIINKNFNNKIKILLLLVHNVKHLKQHTLKII